MNLTRANTILLVLFLVMMTAAWAMRNDPTVPNHEFLPDMQYSPAYDAFSVNPNFANGQTLQSQPPGTIARGQELLHYAATKEDAARAGKELTNPIAADDSEALSRGAEIYRIYCSMCHGPQGLGDGAVTKRGYPPPPSMLTGKSVEMMDGQLFHILTYGQGSMAPYAAQISPTDRWKVITFVRGLQAQAKASSPSGQTDEIAEPAGEPAPDSAEQESSQPTDQENG